MSSRKARRGLQPAGIAEREKLRTLYREYANWVNAFNEVTDPQAIDRVILEMARTNWDIYRARVTLARLTRKEQEP